MRNSILLSEYIHMHYTQSCPSVVVLQPWLNYRGAERISIDLVNSLFSRGVQTSLLCCYVTDSVRDALDPSLLILPPRIVQFLCRNRVFFFVFGFWVLLFLLLNNGKRFDLYNAHNFPAHWVAGIVGRLYGKKTVWYVNNFPQHPFRGYFGRIFEYFTAPVDRYIVGGLSSVCTSSEKVACQFWNKYGRASVVVYSAVDMNSFNNCTSEKKYVPVAELLKKLSLLKSEGSVFITHVGHIHPEKNQQFSIHVFEKISTSFSNFFLVFAGEGDRSFLSMPQSVASRIIFTGRLSREDTVYLYSLSRYVLHPAFATEGCSLTPLEAANFSQHVLIARGCGSDELFDRYSVPFVFNAEEGVHSVVSYIECAEGSHSQIDYSRLILGHTLEVFVDRMHEIFLHSCAKD